MSFLNRKRLVYAAKPFKAQQKFINYDNNIGKTIFTFDMPA